MTLTELEKKACDIRADVVTLIHKAGCGHIGGDMSEVEALVALYYKHLNCSPENEADPDRDRFVLSKGHSVETLYCILADRGYFDKAELMDTYSAYGSRFIGHPNNKIPGIEMNSGSLGHGLSVAVGMAKAGKMDGRDYHVYAVLGDGELAEGSVWEGVMAGGHFKLDNLTALVDRNRLQISGSTEDVMRQDSQETRWAAFGWSSPSPATTWPRSTPPSPSPRRLRASRRSSSSTPPRAAASPSWRTSPSGTTRSWTTPSMRRPWPR